MDGLKGLSFRDNSSSDFIKFKADEVVKLRVFTTDPVVYNSTYTNKLTGEVKISTKYVFSVWNYSEDRAMILDATATIARGIHELHTDDDYGEDVTQIDIKITPTGELLERRYSINVLPKAQTLTVEQEEAVKTLDSKLSSIKKDGIRASEANAGREVPQPDNESPQPKQPPKDVVIEDIGDEPINLDDIPF